MSEIRKVDIGSESYIAFIEVKREKCEPCKYKLELSLDNENWITVSNNVEYTASSQPAREPVNSRARYVRIIVTDGALEGSEADFFDLKAIIGRAPEFITGADVSHLQQIEDFGGRYFNRYGGEQDCLEILKDNGVNYIRLKVWNKPGLPYSDPAGYNDKAHVLEMSKRIKGHGFKLLIDFHYSDWWTDPGKQFMPEEWKGLSFEELKKALYDFTSDVVSALKTQGTSPDMVQVGNEITNGMLWDEARISGEFDTEEQWDKLCALLKNGLQAVKDIDGSIRTIIHIERGGDHERCCYFYDKLMKRGVAFDIIGLSYYPIWHGPLSDFRDNIYNLVLRYGKDIIVVETAYPYTSEDGDDQPNASTFSFTAVPPDYPPSVQNQANILQAISLALKNLPGGKGRGFFYWQPDFIPVKDAGWKYGEGCEWDDQTMFDFKGNALWSLDVFRMHCPDT